MIDGAARDVKPSSFLAAHRDRRICVFGTEYLNTTAAYLSLTCRVFAQHIVDRWHSIAGIELTLNSVPFPFPDKPHHGCCHDTHVSDAQFLSIFSVLD